MIRTSLAALVLLAALPAAAEDTAPPTASDEAPGLMAGLIAMVSPWLSSGDKAGGSEAEASDAERPAKAIVRRGGQTAGTWKSAKPAPSN